MGNFCPRCGQSSTIGRYSFRTALLNFLNVWGIGNRSMFRTLRDLILRPGYMIRDYLMGMQMAYFPPFQMLFLLTTFSFFVIYGFNIKGQTLDDSKKEAITIMEEGEEGDADDGLDAEVGMKADSRYALLGVSDGNHLYRQHDVHLRNSDALLLRSSRMGESHLHVDGPSSL